MKIRRNHIIAAIWLSSLVLAILVTVWVCSWHEPDPFYRPLTKWLPDYDAETPSGFGYETLPTVAHPRKPSKRFQLLVKNECLYIWLEWGTTKDEIREICQYVQAVPRARKIRIASFTYDRQFRYSIGYIYCFDGQKIHLTFFDVYYRMLKTGELDPGQLLILE